jgi:8-oxo-dGTP pyrophosphatase MutT (NUDIX family)
LNDQPRLRVTTYAVVVRDTSLLLTRLSEASPVFEPGAWNLPGGGMDPGEQPRETLARELLEEAGLEVVDAKLLDARSYLAERNDIRWNVISLFYGARLGPGDAKVREVDGAADGVRWVALDRVRELPLSPPTLDGLRLIETATW